MIWLLGCLIILGIGIIGFWILFKIAESVNPDDIEKQLENYK